MPCELLLASEHRNGTSLRAQVSIWDPHWLNEQQVTRLFKDELARFFRHESTPQRFEKRFEMQLPVFGRAGSAPRQQDGHVLLGRSGQNGRNEQDASFERRLVEVGQDGRFRESGLVDGASDEFVLHRKRLTVQDGTGADLNIPDIGTLLPQRCPRRVRDGRWFLARTSQDSRRVDVEGCHIVVGEAILELEDREWWQTVTIVVVVRRRRRRAVLPLLIVVRTVLLLLLLITVTVRAARTRRFRTIPVACRLIRRALSPA